MEATRFAGWIYDHLLPHAAHLKVAHPLMLRAIAMAKKQNDCIDAGKIADCLRCNFLPECSMASTAIREKRCTLRYRNLLVRDAVQLKNKIAGLPLESGVSYKEKQKTAQGGLPLEGRSCQGESSWSGSLACRRSLPFPHL
jgi:transposase